MTARKGPRTVHLYHATAPTCWWSWGYEAVLNRVALVYGNRVKVHLLLGCVYEDLDDWMRAYEMTPEGQEAWARESIGVMGVPIRTEWTGAEPKTVMPATVAVLAARRQGARKGERFMRALMRRFTVEGEDVTQDPVLGEAAEEARLDGERFFRDYRDTAARREELQHQGQGFPHVPLGFYSLALTDGADRTVLLDYAFDPAVVEGAIDYLAGGRVPRRESGDLVGYVRRHGAAPLSEIVRVHGLSEAGGRAQLAKLVEAGRLERVNLAGAPHWRIPPKPS